MKKRQQLTWKWKFWSCDLEREDESKMKNKRWAIGWQSKRKVKGELCKSKEGGGINIENCVNIKKEYMIQSEIKIIFIGQCNIY